MIGMLPLLLTWSLHAADESCAAEPEASAGVEASASTTPAKTSARRRRGGSTDAPPDDAPVGKCVDKTLQQELLAKRKYRLTAERLYVKSLRHELSLMGGYYVSDLFDSTFSLAGHYTFFMSENFGAELSAGWSRLRTSTADAVEESNNFDLPLVRNDILRVFGSLAWSPLYGKVRLVAGSIWRYDFYFLAGPGVVVDPVSYGLAGNFGVGMRVFLHEAVALRFEVRDYLYGQELLAEDYLVNDLSFSAGVGVLLPLRN
jgi:outer membrane beta-barrel protein